jgi:ketosteroid isomerase-like protein
LLLSLFVPASRASAGAGDSKRPTDAATIAALTRQSDQWDRDIVKKDALAIAANMAEDFRQIGSDGGVADKAAFVRDLTSADLTIDPYTVENFDVRLYGDVALLSGTTRMTGRYQGEPFTTHYRYIDIYVRRDGVWKIVSVQTTRIREAAPAQ